MTHKPKTKQYTVIMPGVRLVRNGSKSPVGSVVELTEQKADALINKVSLLKDANVATDNLAAASAKVTQLETDLNATRDLAAGLREEVGKLKASNDSAEARVKEALATPSPADAAKIADLEKQLADANTALTDALESVEDRIAVALATSVPTDTAKITEALATSVAADIKKIADLEKQLKTARNKVPKPPK